MEWASIPVCETVGIAEREVDLRLGSSLDFPVHQLFDLGQFPFEGASSFCAMRQ